LQMQSYAQVLDGLIRGQDLTNARFGSLMIGLLCIAGCGLILYRSKFLAAIVLLLLFSGIVLYGCGWLFQEKGVLVDVPVAIASLLVPIAVFSILKIIHDWRGGAQSVVSTFVSR